LSDSVEEMLEQDNFDVESLSLLSMDAVPEDATAIVINAPTSDLSEDEADLLITYLQGGGNVALLTGYMEADDMTQLKRVTSSMGLTTDTGIIIEGDRQMHINRYSYYLLPTIESHDVTDSLIDGNYYILTPLAQPLIESGEGDADIAWLLTTSDSAYTKAEGLQTQTTSQEDDDVVGTFHVGAVAEDTGKLFWVTCDSLLDTSVDRTVSYANSNLFLNVLNWMGGQEESISIRSKSLDTQRLTVTESASSMWSIIMIGVIPLCLIGIGVCIWVRRKRR
jgi:ABC-2 type transport system permease protein